LRTKVRVTGKTQPEAVAAVLVHHDSDLYDLRIRAGTKTSVIDTTSSHLFFVPGTGGRGGRWVKAGALKYGTHLRTPDGSDTVTVADGWVPSQRDGWMWDLTIPGNNDHDFYIDTIVGDVLVHNATLRCPNGATPPGDTTLYRFGSGPETTEGLAEQSAKAADTPDVASDGENFPHGISTSTSLPSGIASSGEYRVVQVQDLLDENFNVIKTGARSAHFTVELPNPVTDDVTDTLNGLFGEEGG
jgi:hypothetical protein